MGTPVLFFLGAPDGLEGCFWGAGPQSFRDWVFRYEDEHRGTFSPAFLRRLDRIVAEGPGCLIPSDRRDAEVIDEVFGIFADWYCEDVPGLLRPLDFEDWPIVGADSYRDAMAKIESHCSRRAAQCWGYLLRGRPVGRSSAPHPYAPDGHGRRVGYWTLEEVGLIRREVLARFGGVARRVEERRRGRCASTPDDYLAIERAVEAAGHALAEGRGLVMIVG